MSSSLMLALGLVIGYFVVLILSLRGFSNIYAKKFDGLIGTLKELISERDKMIKDAFEERDARFGRLQGVLAQTIIRDTQLFDSMIEDTDTFAPEETLDGYTEDDSVGA